MTRLVLTGNKAAILVSAKTCSKRIVLNRNAIGVFERINYTNSRDTDLVVDGYCFSDSRYTDLDAKVFNLDKGDLTSLLIWIEGGDNNV